MELFGGRLSDWTMTDTNFIVVLNNNRGIKLNPVLDKYGKFEILIEYQKNDTSFKLKEVYSTIIRVVFTEMEFYLNIRGNLVQVRPLKYTLDQHNVDTIFMYNELHSPINEELRSVNSDSISIPLRHHLSDLLKISDIYQLYNKDVVEKVYGKWTCYQFPYTTVIEKYNIGFAVKFFISTTLPFTYNVSATTFSFTLNVLTTNIGTFNIYCEYRDKDSYNSDSEQIRIMDAQLPNGIDSLSEYLIKYITNDDAEFLHEASINDIKELQPIWATEIVSAHNSFIEPEPIVLPSVII